MLSAHIAGLPFVLVTRKDGTQVYIHVNEITEIVVSGPDKGKVMNGHTHIGMLHDQEVSLFEAELEGPIMAPPFVSKGLLADTQPSCPRTPDQDTAFRRGFNKAAPVQ